MALKELSDGGPDGTRLGQSVTDLVAFHGSTVTSQRASATLSASVSIFAISGASWVANTASTFSGQFTYTSGQMIQLHDALTELRAWAVEKGLHKGGA